MSKALTTARHALRGLNELQLHVPALESPDSYKKLLAGILATFDTQADRLGADTLDDIRMAILTGYNLGWLARNTIASEQSS